MTNEQILKKAIEKAGNNGWSAFLTENAQSQIDTFGKFKGFSIPVGIIFSHDFAKAFWGEEQVLPHPSQIRISEMSDEDLYKIVDGVYKVPVWQYHLQRMVLREEPLKYLEKFL